jgi:hypothetical protein
MKRLILLGVGLLLITAAQAQTSSTTIQYNKSMQPAHRLDLSNNVDDVEATILNKLKQNGYKPETDGRLFWKKSKIDGFYEFNNIIIPTISNQKLDMYFKVVQKNAEEKNSSIIYLLVSTGNENFSSPDRDTALWNNTKVFLDQFVENTVVYKLEQDIKKQEDVIARSKKELTTLQKGEKELEDRIKKLQGELLQNQSDQAQQHLGITEQEKSLETLKVKRKA